MAGSSLGLGRMSNPCYDLERVAVRLVRFSPRHDDHIGIRLGREASAGRIFANRVVTLGWSPWTHRPRQPGRPRMERVA
jgi:hypothetical protein